MFDFHYNMNSVVVTIPYGSFYDMNQKIKQIKLISEISVDSNLMLQLTHDHVCFIAQWGDITRTKIEHVLCTISKLSTLF